ncbi:MAG: hypothetical protein J6M30_05785 [Bacteroidales bacterium]|nr:hypothetical protein [Bacteroidales bacterium]
MKHNVTLIVSGNKDQYSIYAEDENLYVFGVGDTLEEAYNDMLTTVSETSVLSPQLQNPYPDWFLNGDYTFSYKFDNAGLQQRLQSQFSPHLQTV